MFARLKRMIELASKNREEWLTREDIIEWDKLRQEHLQKIRSQVTSTMASPTILSESGQDLTPTKLVVEKTKQSQSEFPF